MSLTDIQGTVVDSEGSPVSGATVGLFLASPFSDVIYTTTDNNGDYIFTEHPQATGSSQEWVVTCAFDDGTNRFHSLSNPYVTASLSPPPEAFGEIIAESPGTYSFTIPNGVTSISAVAVGGGGGGGGNSGVSGPGSSAGGGGGLGWTNNISVTPGEVITISVGQGGAAGTSANPTSGLDSYIEINGNRVVEGSGGERGTSNTNSASGGSGGGFIGDGGGNGGNGGNARNNGAGAGGGGAGGYTGDGGNENSNGSGGGGAGGQSINSRPPGADGHGGGVGIFGEGASGTAGSPDGRGGSNAPTDPTFSTAGEFGGGGAGVEDDTNADGGIGGDGAVRIIFGDGRAFPNTNVDQASSDGNITTL